MLFDQKMTWDTQSPARARSLPALILINYIAELIVWSVSLQKCVWNDLLSGWTKEMKYYALSGAGNRIPHERSIDQGGRASGEFTYHAVLITRQPGELRSTCKRLSMHTHIAPI